MSKRLFVGCLPFIYTDAELAALFKDFGKVVHAQMVWDKKHKRTRGFGFVELASDEVGLEAMEKLKGTKVEDKEIWITPAKDRPAPAPTSTNTFPFSRRPEGGRPSGGGFRGRSGPPRDFDRPRRPYQRDDRPGFEGRSRRPFPRRDGPSDDRRPPRSFDRGPRSFSPRRDPNSIFEGPRSGGSDRPSFGNSERKPFGRPGERSGGFGGGRGGSKPGGRSGGGRSGGGRFGRSSGAPRGRSERRPAQ